MIRLGSLAGYPFEGPRLLGGWTPPAIPAVYAILYKPEPDTKPERYADQIARDRAPTSRPRCTSERYGQSWKDRWIGECSAPTTGPLTRRGPDSPSPSDGES